VTETSKTAGQALRLLLEVGERKGSIADLTRRVGIPRTIVQRLLMTLREQGFVMRMPDGQFSLGATISDLAARMESPVRALAAGPMLDLAQEVNETVVLTLRDGDDAVSAEQIGAVGRVVRAEYPPGFRHPLFRAAAGFAILSAADPGTIDRIARNAADRAGLLGRLEEVRRLGYAVSIDELKQGAAGIAAPIIGRTGHAVASLGIIAPVDRFPDASTICRPVVDAARAISDGLRG
jgi:IclR family KDG regulon transcriptional repressor